MQFTSQASARQKAILAACLVPLLGLIDYATGYELGFAPFYFAPIAIAAWHGGRVAGNAVAVLSALTWLVADVLSGHVYTSHWLYVWNTLVRLASFVVIVWLTVERRRLYQLEHARAQTDPLTGLANRLGFLNALERERARSSRRGRPLTIAYIDLDDFKLVNDRGGHEAGDEVLKNAAAAIRAALRSADIAARFGGDEFAVLLPEIGPHEAASVMRRVQTSIVQAAQRAGHEVGASIGCVAYLEMQTDAVEMLRTADQHMYQAKRAGKNRVFISVHSGGELARFEESAYA